MIYIPKRQKDNVEYRKRAKIYRLQGWHVRGAK